MFQSPQQEHHWLNQLMGEWKFSHKCGPDSVSEGTLTTRSMSGMWVLLEYEGPMPDSDTPWTSQACLGFDPQTGLYRGTFVASMMSHLWIYEGELNEDKTALVLNVEGPRMDGKPGMAKYRDIYEIVDADHWILRSEMLDETGDWQPFMEGHQYRVK